MTLWGEGRFTLAELHRYTSASLAEYSISRMEKADDAHTFSFMDIRLTRSFARSGMVWLASLYSGPSNPANDPNPRTVAINPNMENLCLLWGQIFIH